MNNAIASTTLDQPIAAYLAHQRALGRGYDNEERVLKVVRCFVAQESAKDLDQALFDRWCDTLRDLAANTRYPAHALERAGQCQRLELRAFEYTR